jgi:hypothetical protein
MEVDTPPVEQQQEGEGNKLLPLVRNVRIAGDDDGRAACLALRRVEQEGEGTAAPVAFDSGEEIGLTVRSSQSAGCAALRCAASSPSSLAHPLPQHIHNTHRYT